MFPNKPSRFREARHVEVQAEESDLDQMENDMRNLGAYRLSGNARSLIEPDRTPRKLYGDFPAIPNTPKDYEKRGGVSSPKGQQSKREQNKEAASSPRQNRAIGLGQGRKSERPLTRLEKEQEYAAVKLQSMQRGRSQRAVLSQERQENREMQMQVQKQNQSRSPTTVDTNGHLQGSPPRSRSRSLRERRRMKSREKGKGRAQSSLRADSLPSVEYTDQPESEYGEMDTERERSNSDMRMVPSQPESPNNRRSGPSPRKARAQGSSGPPSSSSSSSEMNIDFDAVEQLRLKLKQACTTHKGCEPSKIFDKWDKDKDGELDKDEVHNGLKKLLGRDVLREWNMFENFFAYIDTDQSGTIDRDEFAEFVTTRPKVRVTRRRSEQYDSPKQVYEGFHGTFQGDKHKGGQKAFGAYGDVDKKQKSYYNERSGVDPNPTALAPKTTATKQISKSLDFDEIDFDAVEQLRLKLKVACTTHNGVQPARIFDKWDKDKDGELDRDEVLEGMNKLLGKDVLEEWNMFENFFAYIDTDQNGTIDRDEFSEFVTTNPKVKVTRRRSEAYDSPKQVFEGFHGTFQGDKHKGGQKAFGKSSGDAWKYSETYGRDDY